MYEYGDCMLCTRAPNPAQPNPSPFWNLKNPSCRTGELNKARKETKCGQAGVGKARSKGPAPALLCTQAPKLQLLRDGRPLRIRVPTLR